MTTTKSETPYDIYIKNLRVKLLKSLFKTILPTLKNKPIKGTANEIFQHALDYYENHKTIPSKPYRIEGTSTIKYSAKNEDKDVMIAKGTFYLKNKPQIVNFYQVLPKHKMSVIETFRFGTPVNYFNKISEIVNRVEEFDTKKKNIITVSLLSPCNNKVCKSFEKIAKIGSRVSNLLKKGLSATKENQIIEMELNACGKKFGKNKDITYNTILLPLSSQTYTGVGSQYIPTTVNTYLYEKKRYKSKVKDKKVKEIYDLIEVENDPTGENSFKSIVRIALYYYINLKNNYILTYHCKSGKDRTSIFDSICQSTFYYLSKHKNITEISHLNEEIYENVRNYAKKFLLYGLLIAFYSTSVVGLKLKNIPVAKYMFRDDKATLEKFIGHSSIVSS